MRRRSSLAVRIAALCVGIVAITAVLAGALAVNLVRTSGTATARHTLGQLADAAQDAMQASPTPQTARRLHRELAALHVQFAVVLGSGAITPQTPLLDSALSTQQTRALLAGTPVSATTRVLGSVVFVEGRPTGTGAIVLAQRRADAIAIGDTAARRVVFALLVSAAVALLIGLLVAFRLARPLRRTAAAARALAAGHRDVAIPAEGPAEVAEVADAVNSLAASLAHSEGRQREFLTSVSHELRTPLTSITGYAESLADGVVPADEAAGVGAVMVAEARRLEVLVADLLDLARLEAQDFRLEFSDVDLVAVLGAAAVVWQGRCAAEGVPFRTELPPGPVWVQTDAARVRQVVDGLLQNALRVTPADRPIVLALVPGPWATVEMRDGGPGLTDDDLQVAFQPAELHRRYRGMRRVGTGLGLAIAHRLVTRLGGTIEAGHAQEGGARFTVRLPAVPPT
jgi:two-component system sensor histidine kinase BaeS